MAVGCNVGRLMLLLALFSAYACGGFCHYADALKRRWAEIDGKGHTD
jgi:hypothetical protein